ncbi:hypothetical protein [Nannocystis pusilla]|uniref:hypothetical protein n=1 Tax=Nannocystis pusilla TaxID=889268 RepID=UPI003DA5736D
MTSLSRWFRVARAEGLNGSSEALASAHGTTQARPLPVSEWLRGFALGLLVAVGCGRSDYLGPCASDADCGDGYICTPDGLCIEVGGECVVDDDCPDGEKCLNYECVGPQVCDDNLECPRARSA